MSNLARITCLGVFLFHYSFVAAGWAFTSLSPIPPSLRKSSNERGLLRLVAGYVVAPISGRSGQAFWS